MESPEPMVRRSLMCSFTMRNFINKRLLIVDDEPFNLQSLNVMLKLSLKQLNVDPDIIDPYLD